MRPTSMQLPFFYAGNIAVTEGEFVLDEETSRHAVQVLRLEAGEQLQLTDGKGTLYLAEIREAHKRSSRVRIVARSTERPMSPGISIAISPLKNASRFEWFLEKATELGVNRIIPLLCERTEKQHFRVDRLKRILISAMLQSQQTWLPEMSDVTAFQDCVMPANSSQGFIAHCLEGNKAGIKELRDEKQNALILIGPEGDFTPAEVQLATEKHFLSVSLGSTRLRTETAGIVAAALLRI